MRKTEGFQALFLEINIKTNERYCVFLQYPSFFIRLCLNATASLQLFIEKLFEKAALFACVFLSECVGKLLKELFLIGV